MEGWRRRLCPARFLAYQYSLVKTCTNNTKWPDSNTDGGTSPFAEASAFAEATADKTGDKGGNSMFNIQIQYPIFK